MAVSLACSGSADEGGPGQTGAGGAAAGGSSSGSGGSGAQPPTIDELGLSPSSTPEGSIAGLRVRDADSGIEYDAIGRSDSGSSLTPLVGYNQFWFAWAIFNHGSEIYGRSERVATAELSGDGECAVPCDQIDLGCPGKDCIPSLTMPEQVAPTHEEAEYLSDRSMVVGVSINGDSRAYPHNIFWWHEIANDEVGGVPVIVTHCPLTLSSIGHDSLGFVPGQTAELGISGRLFNNNLTFYNRTDDSWFIQLLGVGTRGAQLNHPAPRVHVWEMTWAAWKALHPDSTVLSDDTGHVRNYNRYPYGNYFTSDGGLFPFNPRPDDKFHPKAITYGVRLEEGAKAYVHDELAELGREANGSPSGVINDTVGGRSVVVIYDIDAYYVQAFDANGLGDLEVVR